MKYDIDYDYEFAEDENGCCLLPEGLKMDGDLYVLPNGRYLPPGAYWMKDGSSMIYEPLQLSPYADMLAQFRDD